MWFRRNTNRNQWETYRSNDATHCILLILESNNFRNARYAPRILFCIYHFAFLDDCHVLESSSITVSTCAWSDPSMTSRNWLTVRVYSISVDDICVYACIFLERLLCAHTNASENTSLLTSQSLFLILLFNRVHIHNNISVHSDVTAYCLFQIWFLRFSCRSTIFVVLAIINVCIIKRFPL